MDEQSNKLLAGYLTARELAQELQKHPRTIYRWRNLRQGPPVTLVGNRPMYRIEAAREWLRSREVEGVRRAKRRTYSPEAL